MKKTIICKNCGQQKLANIRLKGKQQYCGDSDCQRARKAAWQRENMEKDADYRNRQQQSVKRWQQQYPWHRYMHQYRQEHPDYVNDNRKKQTVRNQQCRQRANQKKIVKMDALSNQPEKTMNFIMTPFKMDASKTIVKMDALFVQLQAFHGDKDSFFATFP